MGVKCFWLEPTSRHRLLLRRYATGACPATNSRYHDGRAFVGVAKEAPSSAAIRHRPSLTLALPSEFPAPLRPYLDDPRWPTHCLCGFKFSDFDYWQLFVEATYRRTDTDEEMTLRDAPPGAMWDAVWFHDFRTGPDGRSLIVKCPDGHEWFIDHRASNCGMPADRVHYCWVRHGEPPNITVNKDGLTCGAGGGSVQTPRGYHGFLRNGEFTE